MKSMNWKHIIAMAFVASLALPIRLAAQADEEPADNGSQGLPESDVRHPNQLWVTVTPLTPSTVNAGGSSTSTVTVGFGNSGIGTAYLTCDVQPSPPLAPTCSRLPPLLPFFKTTTFTVSTIGPSARLVSGPGSNLLFALSLPLIGLVTTGLGGLSRRGGHSGKARTALLFGTLLAGMSLALGCGGQSPPVPRTPAGTYTVTVTAKSVPSNSTFASTTITVQ